MFITIDKKREHYAILTLVFSNWLLRKQGSSIVDQKLNYLYGLIQTTLVFTLQIQLLICLGSHSRDYIKKKKRKKPLFDVHLMNCLKFTPVQFASSCQGPAWTQEASTSRRHGSPPPPLARPLCVSSRPRACARRAGGCACEWLKEWVNVTEFGPASVRQWPLIKH